MFSTDGHASSCVFPAYGNSGASMAACSLVSELIAKISLPLKMFKEDLQERGVFVGGEKKKKTVELITFASE